LLETCQRLPLKRRSRIAFEYVMLAGVNDTPMDAHRLVKPLAPLKTKVNLIFFKPFEESGVREQCARFGRGLSSYSSSG